MQIRHKNSSKYLISSTTFKYTSRQLSIQQITNLPGIQHELLHGNIFMHDKTLVNFLTLQSFQFPSIHPPLWLDKWNGNQLIKGKFSDKIIFWWFFFRWVLMNFLLRTSKRRGSRESYVASQINEAKGTNIYESWVLNKYNSDKGLLSSKTNCWNWRWFGDFLKVNKDRNRLNVPRNVHLNQEAE